MDEMDVSDFSLEWQTTRPNRLINAVYGSRKAYFEADASKIPDPASIAPAGEFLARTYIDLVKSVGRNEPDDRVGTIEVIFGDPVPLEGSLIAVVVPDILWDDTDKADWLLSIEASGASILPFHYRHNRDPEQHHAMIEVTLAEYFQQRGEL